MKAIGKIIKNMDMVFSSYMIGIYSFTNGNKYEGEWECDKKHGKGNKFNIQLGVFSYAHGSKYDGEYIHNKQTVHGN